MNDAGNKIDKHRDAAQPEPRSGEERKQREEQLSLLQTITMEVAAAGDLSAALEVVLRRVCEKTGWAFGQAWVPNQDETLLVCGPAWLGGEADLQEFRIASEGSQFGPGRRTSRARLELEAAGLDRGCHARHELSPDQGGGSSGTQGGRRHSHCLGRSSHCRDRVFPPRVAGRERAPGESDCGRGRAVGPRDGTERRGRETLADERNPPIDSFQHGRRGHRRRHRRQTSALQSRGRADVWQRRDASLLPRMVAAIRPLSSGQGHPFPARSIAADALPSR